MSTIDEWGLSSETQRSGTGKDKGFSANIASGFSLRRHQPFLKAIQDYTFAVTNFFNQAQMICVAHGFIGRNLAARDTILEAAKSQGYDENNIRLSKHNLFRSMLKLEAMQAAYDRKVGSLVDPRRLAQVTKRERSLFPELWALWYQFCHFPEKRLQAAGAQSLSAMEGSLAAIRSSLSDGLTFENWSATVISERFEWEDRPALVLRLDLGPTGNIEDARADSVARLVETLRSAVPGSLEGYALDYRWQHILIIPVLNGFALDSAAWIIPCSLLSGKDDQEMSSSPLLRLLQPLPVERVRQLGLEVHSTSTTKSFKELSERLSGIQYHFTHLALFAEQIPNLDEIGRRVLERYLKRTAPQLKARFDGLYELMIEVTQQVRQVAMFPLETLDVFLEPIDRLIQEIEDSRGQTMTVGLEECQARAEQFQEIQQAVGLFYISMLPGVLDARASEPTTMEASEDTTA